MEGRRLGRGGGNWGREWGPRGGGEGGKEASAKAVGRRRDRIFALLNRLAGIVRTVFVIWHLMSFCELSL
jgi:hypothetical protein